MSESDRRIHNRINFQHRGEALVELRLSIEIVNLSVGGMGFKSSTPLEPGTTCHLVLFKGNISVESSVMSCRKIPRRKLKYKIGVEFTKVSTQLLEEVLEMEKHFQGHEPAVSAELETEGKNEVIIIGFSEQVKADDHLEVMGHIQNYLDEGVRNFVMNFKGVDDVEEIFFSQLVDLDEEIGFEGGRMILADCSSKMLSMLTVSHLGSAIPIFESVDKAMEAIDTDKVPDIERL